MWSGAFLSQNSIQGFIHDLIILCVKTILYHLLYTQRASPTPTDKKQLPGGGCPLGAWLLKLLQQVWLCLSPLPVICAFVTGAGCALIGKEAAMACTVAVEDVIGDHYNR